jgi:hypothetical protein
MGERISSCFVRSVRYRVRMSDLPENLVPARHDDLIATLAFALTRDRRLPGCSRLNCRPQSWPSELSSASKPLGMSSCEGRRRRARLRSAAVISADGFDVARTPVGWVQADAEALIRDHDAEADRESRQREHDVTPAGRRDSRRPDGAALAAVALIAATRTAPGPHSQIRGHRSQGLAQERAWPEVGAAATGAAA